MNYCPAGSFNYYIEPQDTIWGLAERFNSDVHVIMEANPGINPENLLVGQMICIPQSDIFYDDVMYDTSMGMKINQMPYLMHPILYPPVEPTPVFTTREQTEKNRLLGPHTGEVCCPIIHPIVPTPEPIPEVPVDIIDRSDLHHFIRLLWIENINWYTVAANDIIYNLPNQQNSKKRFLRNASDFGEALEPFYGDDNAQMFEKLFSKHMKSGLNRVEALRDKDITLANQEQKNQREVLETLSLFFSSINPIWVADEWKRLLYQYDNLVGSYVSLVLTNNLDQATLLVDNLESQALDMANFMIYGIEEQFPDMIA